MSKEPLGKWISILYRYSMIYSNYFLKNFGMSGGQLPFFMNIIKHPGITQDELSKFIKIDKSTTARAIKSLIQSGFVIKEIDKKDKRAHRLYPTSKAIKAKEVVLKNARKWDNVLLKGLSKDERKIVREALEIMVNNALQYINAKERDYEK